MTDLGKLSWFLGIQIECKNNTIKMNQSRYIEKILSKFSMADCSTPCEMDITKTSDEINLIKSDICYTVTRLSQDLAKPNSFHLAKAKNGSRYLKCTINQSLIFKKSQKPLKLEGFCYTDSANLNGRKSVSGFCFRLAENNPMISWKSIKQNSVALSTGKAEFIAISLTTQEALYLRALLRTMTEFESFKNPTTIHCDNQSSLVLEKKTSRSSKIETY